MKKFIQWMITLGSTIINLIKFGSITPSHIDVGSDQVWPDSGPTPPVHTYQFDMDSSTSTSIGYAGGTLVIKINSRCDGSSQDLSYIVQENGQTPSWIHFLQRQENTGQTYNYTYYFGITSNSGGTRHAGFTFTQNDSGNILQLSITLDYQSNEKQRVWLLGYRNGTEWYGRSATYISEYRCGHRNRRSYHCVKKDNLYTDCEQVEESCTTSTGNEHSYKDADANHKRRCHRETRFNERNRKYILWCLCYLD